MFRIRNEEKEGPAGLLSWDCWDLSEDLRDFKEVLVGTWDHLLTGARHGPRWSELALRAGTNHCAMSGTVLQFVSSFVVESNPAIKKLTYTRHKPEESVLYKVIQENWLEFQSQVVRDTGYRFPFPIRLCLAVRPKIMSKALDITHTAISAYYRKKANLPKAKSKTGAVTLIQRYGGSLNLILTT